MLEITYAEDDGDIVEVEITGTLQELRELEASLVSLSQGKAEEKAFPGRTNFKPQFNHGWIKELVFIRGEGDNGDIIVDAEPKGALTIEGSAAKLRKLSDYFYFEDEDRYPEHHHCEWREDHTCLSIVSIPLIISIAGTAEEIEK